MHLDLCSDKTTNLAFCRSYICYVGMVLCSVAKAAKINYPRQLKSWPSVESNRQKQREIEKRMS